MNRLLLAVLFFLLAWQNAAAQSYRIKGSVTDTLINTPLYLSSVVLLRTTDTVIESYTRADDNGIFQLQVSKQGKYILQVSRPGYADYTDVINLKDTLTDLGQLVMLSKEHLLKEYVFTQQVAAIKIKGDTTEYVADSFSVKTGATVEQLLKKLPGIQVDKNGKITAQGVEVQKVLVDGEEFFSDDPKVVTQGLQATVVNKVQVFDKKSDQAEFTGIDDGEKTRTINLQLKENMKKGFFGKLDAGGGSDGYFQNQAMINAFKGKRQFSVFGIGSTTDQVGLGWDENDKYGGSAGVTEQAGDDGSWTRYAMNYDEFAGWDGTYTGDGLPRVWTGGVHAANKWNEDKQHLSGSYRFAHQQVESTGSNSKQYLLSGDTSRVNTETRNQFNVGIRHSLSGLYELKIDTNTSVRLIVNAGAKQTNSASIYHTEAYSMIGDADGVHTINDRNLRSDVNEQFCNTDFLLRRKFAKKGRSFSLNLKQNYNDSKGNGMLLAKTFADSAGSDTTFTDQKKINNSNALSFNGKATYTEPLSKTIFLEVNYGLNINNSSATNKSLEPGPTVSDYTRLNDTVSSDYSFDIRTHQGGTSLKFIYKKVNFSFGSDISDARFVQTDRLHGDTSHTYSYLNFFPRAYLNYKISKQTSFNFSYQGSTRQPTITQIQPLKQNTDPLNIVTGNPGLTQEFTNRFNVRFNNYKVLTNRYIYAGLTFNMVDNAISTEQWLNGPVYNTRYINVDGNYSADWYGGYHFKLKKPEVNIGLSFNGENSMGNNIVNGRTNVSSNNSYSFGPNFNYEKEDHYEFSWNPGITYNNNRSTVNAMPVNYWVLENTLNAVVQLPADFEVGSSANIMLRQRTEVFTTNNSIVKWNAVVSKKFLKKKELELKLSVFDILNQNLGYTRMAQGNTITQNSYTTIRRYGMMSLIWNFRHTPGVTASED